jgi:hypothetical protein
VRWKWQAVRIDLRAEPPARGEDLRAAAGVNRAVDAAPPSSDEFAALTIASVCCLMISPCTSVIRIRPAY